MCSSNIRVIMHRGRPQKPATRPTTPTTSRVWSALLRLQRTFATCKAKNDIYIYNVYSIAHFATCRRFHCACACFRTNPSTYYTATQHVRVTSFGVDSRRIAGLLQKYVTSPPRCCKSTRRERRVLYKIVRTKLTQDSETTLGRPAGSCLFIL